jgi:hypothetical protein
VGRGLLITEPNCPKCSAPMRLTRVVPSILPPETAAKLAPAWLGDERHRFELKDTRKRCARLKPRGDATSHAGYVVVEFCVSAQVARNEFFQQPAAEPFSIWRRDGGAAAFLPA